MAAKATRETRVYVECARSWLIRSIAGSLGSSANVLDLVSGRSSALARARTSIFALFHYFNYSLNARTCNTVKH